MSEENINITENEMEDIVSTSPQAKKAENKKVLNRNIKGVANGLGSIIKAISFLVAFFVLAMFFAAAYLLYTKDPLFTAISIAIIIAGVVVSTIVMFLIFAMGQIITQNNEILKKINEKDR